ncbi:uncharacterized protein LOC111708862 isoform X2 [Eurytemora carolleeae]|uniref:uncharacterized protein LOC111708862 isoform X1 n=1 Tax=Eurytemora carolleeae TaxID=1294199 RepID=UPI000C76C7DE|nr:uncharacterized protein LOC111708862 isoform X1 [Eurytemora carolleeae]XP_023338134.1 uncharacterized protein LOC111708862 isoform X2 [Eurytemora carolleeae]|eukprot:XP_023338133.1 uncharacterized protein LOC111708862 isoform X1 [Eurytemora affinis]
MSVASERQFESKSSIDCFSPGLCSTMMRKEDVEPIDPIELEPDVFTGHPEPVIHAPTLIPSIQSKIDAYRRVLDKVNMKNRTEILMFRVRLMHIDVSLIK